MDARERTADKCARQHLLLLLLHMPANQVTIFMGQDKGDLVIAASILNERQRNADDRLTNLTQLRALNIAGAHCPASFECFAPEVHAMTDPMPALAGSFAFIADQMAQAA